MPAALFVVRATVSDSTKRAAFDDWYHREHLPDAVKVFGATKAWRCWSADDPSQHQASYQFADRAELDRVINSASTNAVQFSEHSSHRCETPLHRSRCAEEEM